ncbi:YdcH family protein [Marinomonas ostreistagni]|uniref:YdcH family protein n=1 Tax=Marinomonas ostreistagni TaxID=359209 RepID=UPI0019511523|nr:YdcH family protein [Marinomonas ostreistagni]MBM6551760.1 YdcH family protein [Marinomonas ostreistagni]
MPIENHSLVMELPEFKEQIHELKMNDAHFRRLFDEYQYLTDEIEKIEKEIVLASTLEEEEFKKRRLALKDTLYSMLRKEKDGEVA